ncbi:MAG: YggS family pyridoxal phosphate-dependent enzyme [Acidiferrobacteraceae bacterium]
MRPPSYIAERLDSIRAAIAEAASAAGRRPEDIRLLAISKQQDPTRILEAYRAGQPRFAENFVQEALPKLASLSEARIEWHFTGALQSNKARYLPGRFAWVHSLASLGAAKRLSEATLAHATRLPVLIEVNVSREPGKHGIAPSALPRFLEELLSARLDGLEYRGLMTVGPQTSDEHRQSAAFSELRELADRSGREFGLAHFSELSMGMSDDFIRAIREGATFVRIGRGIFGPRP